MSDGETSTLLPAAPCVRIPANAPPFLEGLRCRRCGEVHVGAFRACPACSARDSLMPDRLADAGSLHSFSIVHRSFPDVVVPFVSAVVALDDGGFLKGNLIGVLADPAAVAGVGRVRVILQEAPVRDAKGRRYMTYVFQPLDGQD